jgi:hypothetical protein
MWRKQLRLLSARSPTTWAQKLIYGPQAYQETRSQRNKAKKDIEPKNDGILAPTYLDAVSVGQFSKSQSYGSPPRGEASESTNEQRGKSN